MSIVYASQYLRRATVKAVCDKIGAEEQQPMSSAPRTPIWCTARLAISRRGLDCGEVAEKLRASGIQCSVARNASLQCHGGRCWREEGCHVVQSVTDVKAVDRTWTLLRDTFGLDCAHLHVSTHFSGCVLNFLRPSLCTPERPDTGEHTK